ncbi:hypothetical protein DFH08DRAFT_1088336 [Mycena albidolilacea]|uniref:Uncharacterized protein n=1 Tax=Mycena albidolilacea TaxID=1033008 RepID=A0AAD7EB47_9AGAR|nr:hypothetical protein DFH08DRAFT_1088336 [Mycena albidolilacea]
MFSSASIAFTSALLLSFSGISIRGAPVATRTTAAVSPVQACSDLDGKGICVPVAIGGACTNVDTPTLSLIMGTDNDCFGFQEPNCQVGTGAVGEFFLGNPDATFVNTADEFVSSANVKSFSCS